MAFIETLVFPSLLTILVAFGKFAKRDENEKCLSVFHIRNDHVNNLVRTHYMNVVISLMINVLSTIK